MFKFITIYIYTHIRRPKKQSEFSLKIIYHYLIFTMNDCTLDVKTCNAENHEFAATYINNNILRLNIKLNLLYLKFKIIYLK